MGTLIKLFMWLLLSLAAIPSELPAAAAEKAHRNVTAPNTAPVVIALRNDVSPFSFLGVDGRPAGLFVDMWKLCAARTGQEIEFKMGTWKDNLQALETGSADIIGAMLDAEGRAAWIAFSDPLYEVRVQLHFLKREGVLLADRLKGQRIGVVERTAFQNDLRRDYPDLEIVLFATFEEMIHAARAGSIRAFLGMPTLVAMILNRLGLAGEFEVSDEILYSRTLHAGVRKDRVALLGLVNTGFEAISNEELAELERVWLPDPSSRYFEIRSHRMKLTKEEEAWIRRHPRVNLAISEGFAPFSFVGQDDDPVGIWADYLELLKRHTGIDLRVTMAAPWETLMPEIQARTVDGVVCAAKTAEREELLTFTDPYLVVPWVIVGRDDFQLYSVTLGDLSGKKVAVLKTSPPYEILRDHPKVNIVEVRHVEDIWETVSLGKADVGISNLASASYYISRKGITNLKVVGALKDQLQLGLGVRKDWPELVGILNKAVGAITSDEHQAIQKKWMSIRHEQGIQWPVVRRWIVLIVAGSAIILIASMLMWNRRLASEIVKRKQSEQALRESESRYRALFELAPDPMALTDLEDGRLLDVNQAFVSWSGYSHQEVIGKTTLELGFWMNPRNRAAMVERLAAAKSVYGLDVRMCKKGGEVRDGVFSARLTEKDGRRELFSIVHDITQRKRGEEALATANEELAQIIDFLPDATFVIDKGGTVIAWNRAVEEMTGIEARDILGRGEYAYAVPFYGERRPILIDLVFKPAREIEEQYTFVRREGATLIAEVELSSLGGRRCWLRGKASPILDRRGEITGAIESIRDITDHKQAEEALRESRQRVADIIEFLPDATLVLDRDGKIIAWNKAIEEMTGDKASEMLGKGNYEHAVPFYGERRPVLVDLALNSNPGLEKLYTSITRSGDILSGEAFVSHLPAGIRHLSATASVLRDAKGEVVAAIECIRDNTRHKLAEEALRESEARYREFFVTSRDAVFITSPEGQWVDFNDAAVELFGFADRGDLARESVVQRYESSEERGALLKTIEETGFVKEFPARLRQKGGSVMDTLITAVPVRTPEGMVKSYVGTIRDVSRQKRAERALRDSEERNAAIIAAMPDLLFILSEEGEYLDFHAPAENLLAIPSDRIVGGNINEIGLLPEVERNVREAIRRAIATREVQRVDYQLDTPADVRDFEARIARLDDHKVLSIVRDITQQRLAEEERREFEERLQRAEKMEALGVLAGGVAHDLNNVLGIVVGYAEMLADEASESGSLSSYAREILQAGERAGAIVQDLLTLTRRGVPSRSVLNLNRIIIDCMASPEFAKLSSHHPGVKVTTDLEADLLNLSGSSVHLGKSFFNLVSNAAEAMPGGGTVTVKTANQYLDQPLSGYDRVREGDYVVLTITDTGQGISGSDLKRIFEPFYTKKVMGRSGTGLGLAVVWGTVKDHHGYINVESEPDRGTTFTLYIPVTREEITPEGPVLSVAAYLGNGESILVVDDVKEQRELATKMLAKLNYRVNAVANGEEAVEYLQHHRVDLVILDMIMDPGLDGLATYRNILEIQPRQKAIIVSGFSETERVVKARELGAGAYVKKPYVLEKLGVAVRKELDRAG